jgi:hypothetical protein
MVKEREEQIDAVTNDEMSLREKSLDIRLKELEIASKEYERNHKPSKWVSATTNPVIVAAIIAALTSVVAGGITSYQAYLSASQQQEEAKLKATQDELNFQTGTIVAAMNNVDNHQLGFRLRLLLDAGLITGDRAEKLRAFLKGIKGGYNEPEPSAGQPPQATIPSASTPK